MPFYIQTPNIKTADMAQLTLTLDYIKHSPTFSMFYGNISGTTLHVDSAVSTIALPLSGQIMWNPYQGLQVISDTGILGVQSPAMGLVHEFAHVIFGHDEAQATAFETTIARELGEPTRANYNAIGSDVRVQNSTQHTDNGHWTTYERAGLKKVGGLYDGSTAAPSMGIGYPPPPPHAPSGWGFSSSYYSMDSNYTLRDASYIQYPDQQRSGASNLDAEILQFHLGQEDSAAVAASPIEHTDTHFIAAHIVGLHESVHS